MLFKPHPMLTALPALYDLHAGDLIAMVTPTGCAAWALGKLPMFLPQDLISHATKWRIFVRKGLPDPMPLQPNDVMTLRVLQGCGMHEGDIHTVAVIGDPRWPTASGGTAQLTWQSLSVLQVA